MFRVRAGRAERARGRGVQIGVARARPLREHAAPLRGPHQHRQPGQPLVESGHVTSVLTSDWPGSHPPARGQGAGGPRGEVESSGWRVGGCGLSGVVWQEAAAGGGGGEDLPQPAPQPGPAPGARREGAVRPGRYRRYYRYSTVDIV